MRLLLISTLCSICVGALNSTVPPGCCPPTDEYCGYGQSYGGTTFAQMCQEAGLKCNPKDLNCEDGPLSDASCPTYESQCPAKCCTSSCCGAYGYMPGQWDSTCCSAASLCYEEGCDSRCTYTCQDPITWAAGQNSVSSHVLDVNGFHADFPRPVWIWGTDRVHYNDNKLFVRMNTCEGESGSQCQDPADGKGWITWKDDYCLEAASENAEAQVQVNFCNAENPAPDYKTKYNPLQQWNLVKTAYGSLIQLKKTNMCVTVKNDYPHTKTPVLLSKCDPSKKTHSWNVVENQNYPGVVATVSV